MKNNNSRAKNAILGSVTGILEQFSNYFGAFIFRTVFLYVLSSSYLGISALFTNILQVFSLTELGIGSVIAFNMYKPMKEGDEEECASLLLFYKKIYYLMALLTVFLGLVFYPFLGDIIADKQSVPSDVNLNIVYWLFVFQSASSYLCVYMQSLFNADQKGYVISTLNSLYNLAVNVIKIALLFLTSDYTLVLASGIILGLVYNAGLSLYIKKCYKSITDRPAISLSKSKRNKIFKDTGALMCHKVGSVVMNSTDSIILSAFIGVSTLGLYSNYQMISVALDTMLNKVFGSFVPTIGNALLDLDDDASFTLYRRLRFLNIWGASFCAICFYFLINPFIEIWLGSQYLLDDAVAVVMSLHFFWNSSRIINVAFVNASGMFVKDRIRPLIQSILNLAISIVLVVRIGLIGVFIGTLISTLATAAWREGVILYRFVFHVNVREYFLCYLSWFVLTLLTSFCVSLVVRSIGPGIFGFALKLVACILLINGIFYLVLRKTDNFAFAFNLITSKIRRSGNE